MGIEDREHLDAIGRRHCPVAGPSMIGEEDEVQIRARLSMISHIDRTTTVDRWRERTVIFFSRLRNTYREFPIAASTLRQ
jgi:hypothetical protein